MLSSVLEEGAEGGVALVFRDNCKVLRKVETALWHHLFFLLVSVSCT